jgi:hypothetical protein
MRPNNHKLSKSFSCAIFMLNLANILFGVIKIKYFDFIFSFIIPYLDIMAVGLFVANGMVSLTRVLKKNCYTEKIKFNSPEFREWGFFVIGSIMTSLSVGIASLLMMIYSYSLIYPNVHFYKTEIIFWFFVYLIPSLLCMIPAKCEHYWNFNFLRKFFCLIIVIITCGIAADAFFFKLLFLPDYMATVFFCGYSLICNIGLLLLKISSTNKIILALDQLDEVK